MRTSLRGLTVLLLAVALAGCGKGRGADAGGASGSGYTLIETGELAAVNSKAFIMERLGRRWYESRIIWLAEHGKEVHIGDTLYQLDPSNITNYITNREADLESQQAALEKLLVNQSNKENANENTIRAEEATYELSKLSMESARFESERQRRIRELQFRQATIRLERAKRNLELNNIIAANDLKIQQIRVQLVEKDVDNAYSLLPRLTVCSTTEGIFQIEKKRRWSTELLSVGDEVNVNQTIARVPDLRKMKVNTYIHKNDFLKIHVGQPVTVRLDALPGVAFPGKITSIGRLCHTRQKADQNVKVFDVEVEVMVSDERLRPGMTVSCEFLPDKKSKD